MSDNKQKITIKVEVEYDPATLEDPRMISDLAYHIEKSIHYHIGNGMLTGTTGAIVEEFTVNVEDGDPT